MTCGIYKIQHKESGRLYIGSSKNVWKRISSHKGYLRKNNHRSQSLQNAFNKHGECVFCFELLLVCSEEHLLMYEQAFMDFYKSYDKPFGYNMRKIADSNAGLYSENARIGIKKKWQDSDFKETMRLSNVRKSLDPNHVSRVRKMLSDFKKDPIMEDKRKRAASLANSLRCKGKKYTLEQRSKMWTKLTEQDVISIRSDSRSSRVLAKIYNITKTNILHVKNRKTWIHLTESP